MSTAELRWPACDLRTHSPRSPRVMLGGLVLLARTIDKARAIVQGTPGNYKIGPGLSSYLLRDLGIAEDDFMAVVAGGASDEEIAAWVNARSDPAGYAAINDMLTGRAIRDEAHRAEVLPRYPVLQEHPHLRNWFDILDLDDVWEKSHRSAGEGTRPA